MALSSPMKLTSSASFSPSIRISLRLKSHRAQAKNFCRVLDIRVTKLVEMEVLQPIDLFPCRPAHNPYRTRRFKRPVRSEADKGYFLVSLRDFFRSRQTVNLVISMQDRKTSMPLTAPQTIPFGETLQKNVSRNLSEATRRGSVSKQGN